MNKVDCNILFRDDVQKILSILKNNNVSKEELILKTFIPSADISVILDKLTEDGWITHDGGKYSLCRQSFAEIAGYFMQFCTPATDECNTDINTDLCEHFFMKRESEFHHAGFERELTFYENVSSGNMETVKTIFTPLGGEDFGILSKDFLQNLKYHLVVSIAMITRFCIRDGMLPEEAYSLSDVYIMKTDECRSVEEINNIHYDMTIDFTARMRQIKSRNMYSKPVILALDYISDHLHSRIFIEDIAEYLSLSVPYFSRLFKAEVGMSFSQYVSLKKTEAAANMLRFSDCTAIEISNYLCFSSHSYFIKIFRSYMGMTPKEYREKYYSTGWLNKKFIKSRNYHL